MDNYKISLTDEALSNPSDTLECLISAAGEIAKASDSDFQSLKETKWYTRLWKLVTFSKDNEKKLARGVQNVAKLQEIVMKALLILSGKCSELSGHILEHEKMIRELAGNTHELSEIQIGLYEELERLKSGLQKSISFNDIDYQQRQLIINALFIASKDISNGNEDGKRYLNKILLSSGCDNSSICTELNPDALEDLSKDEGKFLYRLIAEFSYLTTKQFESEGEIAEAISLSGKAKKEIQSQIQYIVETCGKEALFMHVSAEDFTSSTGDSVEWNTEDASETEEDDTKEHEVEELNIDDMLFIESGETYSLKYKIIHFKTWIECKGKIELDYCEIHYNEFGSNSGIRIANEAGLTAKNCKFVCHSFNGNDGGAFIESWGTTEFLSCTFEDCSKFVKSYNFVRFDQNCICNNCGLSFVYIINEPIKGFEIKNSKFLFEQWKDFNKEPSLKGLGFRNSIIECMKSSEDSNSNIENVNFECSDEFYNEIIDERRDICLVNTNGLLRGCSFKKTCFYIISIGSAIEQCEFKNCRSVKGIIRGSSLFSDRNKSVSVMKCEFCDCYDEVVSYGCKFSFEYCKFMRCKAEKYKDIIRFVSNGREYATIRFCKFIDCEVVYGYIISGGAIDIGSGILSVSNCDFINCKKSGVGGLINKYDTYKPKIGREKCVLTVSVSNCTGL